MPGYKPPAVVVVKKPVKHTHSQLKDEDYWKLDASFPESQRYNDALKEFKKHSKHAGWYLQKLELSKMHKSTLFQQLQGEIGVERITKAALKYI